MKNKFNLKGSIIVALIMALILSAAPAAFAATTDSWATKAPMSTPRSYLQTEVVNRKVYAIGGFSGNGKSLSCVEEYNSTTNTWATKSSMFTPRMSFQTEVIGGKIYAIGGCSDGSSSPLNSVEEYDPVTDTWTIRKSMPTPRGYFKTEVVGGKIYAIGGYNGESSLSCVEEYDPATDTWTIKKSMSTPRRLFETEVIDGKIYVIGGFNGSRDVSSVEEYDPSTDIWTTKKALSTPRSWFQTEVIDGKIYAIGGDSYGIGRLASVEEYDPITNTWTAKKSMSIPRHYLQTEVIDGRIYAIGGDKEPSGSPLTIVEEYDPVSNTWTAKPSMSVAREHFQSEVINGKIYAIGGYTNDSTGTHALSSLEEYTVAQTEPILTVTPSSDKVKVGQQFTTDVAIHNVTDICAEDIKITYDTNLFEYVGAEAQTGLKIYKEDSSTAGTIRFIVASLGKDNAATGDKNLINLKFKAKKPGVGKVDIVKGHIADNATLEMDVADENCGEATITVETSKDVNRSGEVTLLDLGIDAGYYGMDASDTDLSKYDTDVNADGKIDDNDLIAITQDMLTNGNYGPNNWMN